MLCGKLFKTFTQSLFYASSRKKIPHYFLCFDYSFFEHIQFTGEASLGAGGAMRRVGIEKHNPAVGGV